MSWTAVSYTMPTSLTCAGMRFSRWNSRSTSLSYVLRETIVLIDSTAGLNRSMYPQVRTVPALCAIPASSLPSLGSYVKGFSNSTCFLAFMSLRPRRECVKVGVATTAASNRSAPIRSSSEA